MPTALDSAKEHGFVDILAERRQRLASLAKSNGLGAIAFVPGANFSDLSGLHFHLMEGPILLFVTADNQIVAIIPELERAKWAQTFPHALTFFWQDSDGYQSAFSGAADALKGCECGFSKVTPCAVISNKVLLSMSNPI